MRHPDVTIVDEGYQVGIVRTHGGIQSGSGGFSLQTYILVLHSRISDSSLPVFHKETAAPCVRRRDLSRRRVTRRRGRWYDPRLGPDHSWWCPNWHISYAPTAVVLLCCENILFRNVKYFSDFYCLPDGASDGHLEPSLNERTPLRIIVALWGGWRKVCVKEASVPFTGRFWQEI